MSIKIKKGKNEDCISDSLANARDAWFGDRDVSIRHNKRN